MLEKPVMADAASSPLPESTPPAARVWMPLLPRTFFRSSYQFWRLFIATGALVLGSIGILGAVVVERMDGYLHRQIEESLRSKAILIRETVPFARWDELAVLQAHIERLGEELATRITLMADDGTVLADSSRDPGKYTLENHATRPEIQAARTSIDVVVRRRHSNTLDIDMMYVALRLDAKKGPIAFVRVALPLDQVQREINGLVGLVWSTAGITIVVGLVLAFWLARSNSRPLQELSEGARRIAAGEYGHSVYALSHDDVGSLARSFNHMSERLASQFTRLEEDRQQLRAVLSSMDEGVVAVDAEQRILFTNERAGKMLEFETLPAIGRKLWETVRQRSIQEIVRRTLGGQETISEEVDWSGPTPRNLTVHAARLWGPGSPGAVLVCRDTSELRRLERLRQDFVANVSHELKTPLSVIKACIETLIDGAIDDPLNRDAFLQQAAEQADHLHALIIDLLSLARIETGAELFEFQSIPLEATVVDCVERHHARAESKNQELCLVGPSPPKVSIWADEDALNQILDNLVDNALKYTPTGGRIQVRWRIELTHVCLEVEDNGIGIPDRDLPRIFERFYRVDKARSRELGGTGLGLAIVKHLVQSMHGNVQATSKIGQGTTFQVRMPRARVMT